MLKDKVALVTGGSRGIGRAIVIALAKEGAKVVINYRSNEESARETLEEVEKLGAVGYLYKADVSNEEEVENMFKDILTKFGRLDILVNNAGITRDNLLLRMKLEDWEAVMATNLRSVFLCTRAAAKIMIKQRSGRIINISSIVGEMGNIGQANYSASKAGIIGFTKTVARELASRGITVNAVAPGFIETEMTESIAPDLKDLYLKQIPLQRFGKPEEVANLVKFLASEEAGYITGAVINIDGGLAM
ncbi:MAG: beta-ketoacyl-ACP reductase [Dictyoglomus sp. NZ13-RE01]|nr:MAG: beta-ketoacyl-ACP reductase [Dictyoglomus sp. NZ13-RE01]